MKFILSCIMVGALCIAVGCEKRQGPLEKAGNRVDEIVDNAKDGDPLFHKKGPIEKAGEAVDDALDTNRRR